MIPIEKLKQYQKIFLLFFFMIFLSCFIAPAIKVLFDALLPSSEFLVDLLNYEDGMYNFARVTRRIIMAEAIIVIIIFRKSLTSGPFRTLGLKRCKGGFEQLQMGFLISIGLFILCITVLSMTGNQFLQIDADSGIDLVLELLKILLIAGIVGCIEEIFFRGIIFQGMLKDMSVISAVCFSSAFYSILHFFKAKFPAHPGFQPFIGFQVAYQSFSSIIVNFTTILPSFIGLFLVGVILSYAFVRTKSLYLSIGLHAGWVFSIKTNSLFFDHTETNLIWLYGDGKVVTGALGWGFLIITLILVRIITKTHINGKNITGTS